MIQKAEKILREVFGYNSFRPMQKEVIENIISKRDTLAIMPTGGGKSLCYQIPALVFEGMTIVVSPLISLMKDQVEQLLDYGVKSVYLNSSLKSAEYRANVDLIESGRIKLLYAAPETLLMERTIKMLAKLPIDCFTIDEAHCISEWGHDFRPVYRQISELRPMFKDAALVALTATATPRVQEDIIRNLKFKEENKFIASFDRPNLFLQVEEKITPLQQTIRFLDKHKNQSGIIYCFSRSQVDELSEELSSRGYSVKPYHAGMSDKDRHINQEQFIRDDVGIIVATIAFGMGINKPNVRFVIHYDLPKNIESYYQEIGRAGRDGLRADCLLLFSYGDIRKIKYFIDQKEGKEKTVAINHLDYMVNYAESNVCRRIIILNYFGENYSKVNCGMCDNCGGRAKELTDITIEAQKFMSCAVRTNQLYGAGHIIDILRGSKNKKIMDRGHNKLSTFNIGRDLTKEQWFSVARQLIQNNCMKKEPEYGSLKVTDFGREVLRGNKKILGAIETPKSALPDKPASDYKYDEELFRELRKLRKSIADNLHLPPYIIFSDRTLVEMARVKPRKKLEFMRITGVGHVKNEKYGAQFLKLIKKFG